MSEAPLLIEQDGHVLTVTLNRPDRLNTLNYEVRNTLTELWPKIADDPTVRVVIVTGAGDRAFCAGGDVEQLAGKEEYPRFTARQAKVYKPVITAVNGVCAGAGLHFVADADIVIASDQATFLDPHVNVGQVSALEPIGLSRKMPLDAVLRMVVLGKFERLDAQRALELHLVGEVVLHEQLMERARELAGFAAAGSPRSTERSLRVIWESLEGGMEDGLQRGFQALMDHREHPDSVEGPAAFMEKRDPNWVP